MNIEIRYIRKRLKELKILVRKLERIEQFEYAEVLSDYISEIEDSLKALERRLK